MQVLRAVKIGATTYFCNELQIEEAGSLKEAGKKMDEERNPKPLKKTKVENGEKPEEK